MEQHHAPCTTHHALRLRRTCPLPRTHLPTKCHSGSELGEATQSQAGRLHHLLNRTTHHAPRTTHCASGAPAPFSQLEPYKACISASSEERRRRLAGAAGAPLPLPAIAGPLGPPDMAGPLGPPDMAGPLGPPPTPPRAGAATRRRRVPVSGAANISKSSCFFLRSVAIFFSLSLAVDFKLTIR